MTIEAVDAQARLWRVSANDWYPALRQMADQTGNSAPYPLMRFTAIEEQPVEEAAFQVAVLRAEKA